MLSIIRQALASLLLTNYRTTNFATLAKINKSEKKSPIIINVCIHRRTVWKTGSYAKYVILLKYRDYYYYYYYKVLQQEHLITELENSKKILVTQLILSRRASVNAPAVSTDTPATSSYQLVESKMMFLEQCMHLLEMDCLRMRQKALRAEQLRTLELQQNLLLGKQDKNTNPTQRSPDDRTYIQRQNSGHGIATATIHVC